ncbi:MAG: bifunctional phosphoribosylaminoimidazolecarboxamide formyltransferase/IMP cyclohydrolase [Deltaproteobacteria bacterium]|nr:bifunctional phosphoribosylaminoimidazolecarboxamide formyltransferase/IMP cyclohydrolase [Deltaproteobacteria bacterium]
MRRALLSVADKTGIVEFAGRLHTRGVALLSTGGTARALTAAGIPVEDVSDYTGVPEMLDGRVKTLHPKIHGGILAVRSDAGHMAALRTAGIAPIDCVAVNLYPFQATALRADVTPAEAVEQIDIGGPTLLRAAAKNAPDVAAICDPADYAAVLEEFERTDAVSSALALRLARKVFAHTAAYDAAIARYLQRQDEEASIWPERIVTVYERIAALRYGENPHQQAAWYRGVEDRAVLGAPLQGKALSYNNLLDADAAIACVREFAEPAVVIVKHTNPCGVGCADAGIAAAFVLAQEADPTAAFGGIVACNRALDAATARAIGQTFFEVVLAPAVAPEALAVLGPKKHLRVMAYDPAPAAPYRLRSACGGLLIQERDAPVEDPHSWKTATRRAPTAEEHAALTFAWRVAKHVRSNAIVIADAQQTRGIGAGQMARVDAVRIAVQKAAGRCPATGPAVAASDAFFPFADGIEELAHAGVRAIVQPGGSIRDAEVIAAADRHDMAMLFTGIRHFRH